MTTLEQFVSPALTRALGWALLHSLWQGALVAAVLAGALLLLRRQRAEVRYAASAGALGVVVALAGLTFGLYFNSAPAPGALPGLGALQAQPAGLLTQIEASATVVSAPSKGGGERAASGRRADLALVGDAILGAKADDAPTTPLRSFIHTLIHSLNNHLPLLVLAWLLGLLGMSLRMLGGLLYVQRLKRYRVRPLSADWQARLAALAARSGVRQPVALLESALVRVPLVVGHLRPVILLPLGTVAGLSPACLEAILAHELAHVLRRDYLVNLLQTVAEVLFFYHPAVWFMANCVRTERENCCDDTATALVGGDPLRLARALTALAEWSQSAVVLAPPRLALAAINRPGALLLRVRRLVQRRPAAPTLGEGLLAGALVLGGLGLLGSSVALAGPLAANSSSAEPGAFYWQTRTSSATKPVAVADTNKRAARVAPAAPAAPLAPDAAAAPAAPPAPEAAAAPATPADDTQEAVERRQDGGGNDPRAGRRQRERRVIINGRAMGRPAAEGNPGTVVITKDKKGRLTDLVVNGQRVETAAGKGKKGKAGKGRQVEVVQVAPFGGADVRTFAFRTDGGEFDPLLRREVERAVRREITRDVQRDIQRDVQRNQNFQFDFPALGEQPDRSFHTAPGSSPNRVYRLKSLNNAGLDSETRRSTLDALRGAARGLRTAAAAKGLNARQRQEINQELAKVQAQIRKAESSSATSQAQQLNGSLNLSLDLREQEMHEHEQEMREHRRELQERIRESQQELRDLEQDRPRDQAARRPLVEALVDDMQKDGLIQDKDNFQLRLTPNALTMNGKELPAKVRDKYLKMYGEASGQPLTGNRSLVITRNSDSSSSTGQSAGPRPPRVPRVPRVPMPAPPMGALPPPPAPPRPPRVDATALRSELRKDGVLAADEKNLQFQLNASGLMVNGKKQSAALADKYRKMTGHADNKDFNITISTQED